MEQEQGDDFIRRLATFVRTNEKGLAEAGFTRRRRPTQQQSAAPQLFSYANPLTWLSSDSTSNTPRTTKPVVLSTDLHHLFYILMRQEELGYDVGTLDVEVDNPSRPTSYINFGEKDKSDTLSLASFRSSLSAVSNLSLGVGWWSRPEVVDVNSELKYLFSSFTKLPALSVGPPSKKVIAETLNDMPSRNAIPLDAFKNLQSLECIDIDPRLLLGWDRLAESLRSLKIKKSGIEDMTDIFIGAVVDDQARRAGSSSRKRRRNIPRSSDQQLTFQSTQLPDMVPEVEENEEAASGTTSPTPSTKLSSFKWAFLRHLSLADNGLTFIPQDILPYLTSLSHLDLSSNLFNSVPAGLGNLHNLIHLNLTNNMIDSVLGIYLNLGQVLYINLSSNRLESICGLERLQGLERVDLRHNHIEESAEIGRLATLPNITEVWVEGNPFCEIEENYRVTCFDFFWKERKSIVLDGKPPGFYEKRGLTAPPPEQMTSSRPLSTASSPPIVPVTHSHIHSHSVDAAFTSNGAAASSLPEASNPSPSLSPLSGGRGPRKKPRRIVGLDGDESEASSHGAPHSRIQSGHSLKARKKKEKMKEAVPVESQRKWGQIGTVDLDELSTPKAISPTAESTLLSGIPAKAPSPSRQMTADFGSLSSRRPRHSRFITDISPRDSMLEDTGRIMVNDTPGKRQSRNGGSRPSTRRLQSMSLYEGPTSHSDEDEGGEIFDNGEALRKRLEALKKDVGESWLQIYSQTQVKSPS
ncbi:hypothetical protein NP233_g3532 [Leucocoprinus birnbaumii]|uniref:Leucine-rich repeat-containing protein n=1 Tax=Leucocoprinus birnbaumii TaxID=56174 RepID=A0AAD5VYX4_9AGAR|nr:hypothetical protein NP233_g3532 [Leucocoprinus birnbaumii]